MQKYKVGDKVRLKSDHRISDVRRLETQAECDNRIKQVLNRCLYGRI